MKKTKIESSESALLLLKKWFENKAETKRIKAANVAFIIANDIEGGLCCEDLDTAIKNECCCEVRHRHYLQRQEIAKESRSIMNRLRHYATKSI